VLRVHKCIRLSERLGQGRVQSSSMKLRELESHLSDIRSFENPKVELEQYPTSPHLAAKVVHAAESRYGDIADRAVLDLGCGGGVLAIGAALCGASYVVAVDVDSSALDVATDNAEKYDVSEQIDFVAADIVHLLPGGSVTRPLQVVDTVIMNPPFGTKRKGIDMVFLQVAITYATGAVYSLHKSSTRDHIDRKVRSWGAVPEVLAQLRFDIPNMYGFHKQKAVDVEVDLWRFDVSMRAKGQVISCNPEDYLASSAVIPTPQMRTSRGRQRRRTRGNA
jgi:rRNA N6-adenosine-methyltransferase METTL5